MEKDIIFLTEEKMNCKVLDVSVIGKVGFNYLEFRSKRLLKAISQL